MARSHAATRAAQKLIIATTANINANREVPPGRGGFCLAFDSDNVTLRADPCCGEPNVVADNDGLRVPARPHPVHALRRGGDQRCRLLSPDGSGDP